MSELREHSLQVEVEAIICGENPYDIKGYIDQCRPLLRKQFPGSRARAFVWYLESGPLVTFYRKASWFQIEVLVRYIIDWVHWSGVHVWTGDYEAITDELRLRWWEQRPPP